MGERAREEGERGESENVREGTKVCVRGRSGEKMGKKQTHL